MTTSFCDERMDREHPSWGGVVPTAAARVFDDLTRYQELLLSQITQRYWIYQDGPGARAEAEAAGAGSEAPLLDYYAQTPHYLYELSYWESSQDKQSWFEVLRRACRQFTLQRVLDFGGGVGGLSLALRRAGIACDHLDVPGQTSRYAAWRFERHAVPVTVLNALAPQTWPRETYDAVIAWDVLEHLFDLDASLRAIRGLLRPGGWLLGKSTFATATEGHCHIHLAKHVPYSDVRVLNELMQRCGFGYVGQLKPNSLSRAARAVGMRGAVLGVKVAPRLKHGGNFLIHRRTD